MADDDPATNSGLNLSYMRLQEKLIAYLVQCQDRLASLTMLPPDLDRYTQLTYNFLSGVLPYAEFFHQMYGDLLQNPKYAHLGVYWFNYHQHIIQGMRIVDSPLFTFPIILCANMGIIPIPPDDIAQFEGLVTELWNQVPEQSRILVTQQVRNRELAYQQEVKRQEEWSRQQELARQQHMGWQQQMAWQQYTRMVAEELYLATEEERHEKNRRYRERRAEKKKRLQREREQAP